MTKLKICRDAVAEFSATYEVSDIDENDILDTDVIVSMYCVDCTKVARYGGEEVEEIRVEVSQDGWKSARCQTDDDGFLCPKCANHAGSE